jgi:hypothetical protein
LYLYSYKINKEGLATLFCCVFFVLLYISFGLYYYRGHWFGSDSWDYIFRAVNSLGDILKGHGSHLTVVETLIFKSIYGIFGLVYWPYMLPHFIFSILLAGLYFQYYWRNGGDTAIGFIISLFLLIGVKPTIQASQFGIYLNLVVLVIMAGMFERRVQFSIQNLAIILPLMVLTVLTGPIGVFNIIAVMLISIYRKKFNMWFYTSIFVFVLYILYYYFFVLDISQQSTTLSVSLYDRAVAFVYILIGSINILLRNELDSPWNIFVAASILFFYIYYIRKNGITKLQEISILVLLLFIMAVTVFRFSGDYPRYFYSVFIFILLAFPVIKKRQEGMALNYIISVVLIGSVFFNVYATINTADRGRYRKAVFDRIIELVNRGEPTRKKYLHPALPQLTSDMVHKILNDRAYTVHEGNSENKVLDREVRASLRVLFWPAGKASGGPLSVLTGNEIKDSCISLSENEYLRARFKKASVLEIYANPDADIRFGWEDEYGVGVMKIPKYILNAKFMRGRITAHLLDPDKYAVINIKPVKIPASGAGQRGRVKVCGNFI